MPPEPGARDGFRGLAQSPDGDPECFATRPPGRYASVLPDSWPIREGAAAPRVPPWPPPKSPQCSPACDRLIKQYIISIDY